ncbi:MAG: hypothetical protein IH899_02965 [Planctomycetes bacterium]|nr:hypothetical protein [Planctomycetota bacterium]
MRKESGNPSLYHSCSPLALTEPVAEFNSDINPHWMRLRRLVNVKMLVVMKMDITEDHGVSDTCHSNHPVWRTGGLWR